MPQSICQHGSTRFFPAANPIHISLPAHHKRDLPLMWQKSRVQSMKHSICGAYPTETRFQTTSSPPIQETSETRMPGSFDFPASSFAAHRHKRPGNHIIERSTPGSQPQPMRKARCPAEHFRQTRPLSGQGRFQWGRCIEFAQRNGDIIGATAALHLGNGKFHDYSYSFKAAPTGRNRHGFVDPPSGTSLRQRMRAGCSLPSWQGQALFQPLCHGASHASGTLFSSSSGDFVSEPVAICIGLNGGSSCIAGFVRWMV